MIIVKLIRTKEIDPKVYKIDKTYVEKRSRRVQLLLQPSLHSRVKAIADQEGCSVNELIHHILQEVTKGD